MTEGLRAFEGKDFEKARAQANVALGLRPGDRGATKLRDDAQSQLDLASTNDQKNQPPKTKHLRTSEGKDYEKERAQANVAVGLRPGDRGAIKVRDDARGQLDLASVTYTKLLGSMTEGLRAFEGKDFEKARAQANVALGLRPGDREATKLRYDAQGQLDLAST